MQIVIDHKLRIAQSELPSEYRKLIVDALSIPNVEKEKARALDTRGWRSMPDFIKMYESEIEVSKSGAAYLGDLVMPRGFLPALCDGLRVFGANYEVVDNTIFETLPGEPVPVMLRSWQTLARNAIFREHDGIWKAPAGSGKTVGVLGAIGFLNCPSIVLVGTNDILYQWKSRAKQFLGEDYPVGLIGDGNFEISDFLTVATVQTLHSRFEELERSGFFEQFSFMCLDECHHATAKTYSELVNRFSSRYRIGVSATPDKTGDFTLATNVIGPIIHETKRKDVTTLIEPTIFRIPTGFKWRYSGAGDYQRLIHDLIYDTSRNALICATIMLNKDRHQLVCSQRLAQLNIIKGVLKEVGYPHPIIMLTGAEDTQTRAAAIDVASSVPCVLLSTLADEALDIPRIDGVHLVHPQRNTGLVQQQIGRGAREAQGKKDFHVFDYCDPIKPMEYQWQARRNEIYLVNNYTIETVLPDQIMWSVKAQEGWR